MSTAEDKVVVRPGDRHFIRDMAVVMQLVSLDRSLTLVELTPEVASTFGTAGVGLLATLVDVGAADPALANCRPDWTATQDLSVHATGWITEGPVLVDTHLVRMGKKVIITKAEIYDCHGEHDLEVLLEALDRPDAAGLTLAAKGLLTFARLPGHAAVGVDDHEPAQWVGQVRHHKSDAAVVGTTLDRMGVQVVDAASGSVELARTPYVANSIGTINGGALALLVQAAAEAMRPGMMATDLQLHYLSQVKVGPARTTGSVSRDGAGHTVVTIDVVDAGNGNQLLSLATVTLQHRPG